MRLPMGHLLAGSAVAGLLFLLPAGGANAQDNRNTSWGWGAAGGGGVVLSFIAAAVGAAGGSSIALWQLSKLASKGKRDDEAMVELALTKLNSSVKVLEEKSTKLEAKSEEVIQGLSPISENKINLENKIDTVNIGLGTMKSDFAELNDSVKESVNEMTSLVEDKIDNLSDNLKMINQHINGEYESEHKKALEDLDQEFSRSLKQCEDEKESLKASVEEKELRLKSQESSENKQWEIMEDLCKKYKNNQKTNPIDYLKLIKVTKSIKCLDCLGHL